RGHTEKAFLDGIVGVDAVLPQLLAGGQLQAVQVAVGPERDDAVAGNHRRRPRPVPLGVVVVILALVGELPALLTGRRIETLDHFLVVEPMEEDEPIASDDGSAEPFADLLFPELWRPLLRPRRE